MNDSPVSIGRLPDCDICLDHASVSGRHAEVTALGDGRLHVIDVGSRNGTFIVEGDRRTRIRNRVVDRAVVLVFGSQRMSAADVLGRITARPAIAEAPSGPPSRRLMRCPDCGAPMPRDGRCPSCAGGL